VTTKQILDADPEIAYLIDNIPDVIWRAAPESTEDHPVVTLVEVIEGRFVNPA
jgi:hypothetical protein